MKRETEVRFNMSTVSKIALPVAKAVKNLMWPRQHWLKALVIPTTDAFITANLMALTPQGRKWLADSQQFMLDKGMLPFREGVMTKAAIDDLQWPENPQTKVPKEPNSWPKTMSVLSSATKTNLSNGLASKALIDKLKHDNSFDVIFKKLQANSYDNSPVAINSLPYIPTFTPVFAVPSKRFLISEATQPLNWTATPKPDNNRFFLGLSGDDDTPKLPFNQSTHTVASLLQQRFGLPGNNTVITSREPTLHDVLLNINKIATKVKQSKSPAEVVIVYNGHGSATKTGKGEKASDYEHAWHFKPDSNNKSDGVFLEKDLKKTIVSAFPKNTKITLINLACYSGALLN